MQDNTPTTATAFNQNAGPNNMFGMLLLLIMGAAMEQQSPGNTLIPATPRPQVAALG